MSSTRSRIASVEDADDDGNIIQGTSRYAASVGSKENSSSGRARKEHKKSDSSPIVTNGQPDSDSTQNPRRSESSKTARREREKSTSGTKRSSMSSSRPVPRHANTTGNLHRRGDYDRNGREIEASYYGVSPTMTTSSSRPPRPQTSTPRPVSYYGTGPTRPPPPSARYIASGPPPPPQFMPQSYPATPPTWAGPGPMQPFPIPTPGSLSRQATDYFSAQPVDARLDAQLAALSLGTSPNRPRTALAYRTSRTLEYGEADFDEENERSMPRPSLSHRKLSRDEDARRMPPPVRSSTAHPSGNPHRPPPVPSTPGRRASRYADEDQSGDALFALSPTPYEYQTPAPAASRARSKSRPRHQRRPSVSAGTYEDQESRMEIASRHNRRHSYYGAALQPVTASGSGYEEKIRQAAKYQTETLGGDPMPLTAETLRRAQRNGGSSRSTKSSEESRDESDYRHSATTRTTRSSANPHEDVTIRVMKGKGAVLEVNGAKLKCAGGAEINISRNAITSGRNGNEKAYYDYEEEYDERQPRYIEDGRQQHYEERHSRAERSQTRARAASRARSRPRSMHYAGRDIDGTDYDYIPAYPEYPSDPPTYRY
ncbi:hypothetical protein NEUTE1DRAFT_127913 [Neurospora tetrasperma FGSC 2508]|uniref:Uncharacterized protein n=1 Tax=Neurospora tetrasperma (strain FGSC 2508 / ATCC MYA-4615 / P0657) TaxID=510951 RepID=F8MC93_NEUT8|nr:uncharacterized protein NEUTE1DRAFT_127913 [Neurospora tetrasperma FGSC 2508]EGO61248.1 hypothetical protein NEUTE1DRAFT_127913 [Neurospora tetrasperma FGSC 2508]EGZ74745.1 hypothetical protein NEUTE2DRAFT_82360 [Neurospora tetrasperma FGSC 2509]